MRTLILATAALTASAFAPVTELNVTKYLGHWYQMYDDAAVQDTFESQSFCDCADYALAANGSVLVHNRERLYSVSGPESEIFGYAEGTTGAPGVFTVFLQGVPVGAPYWVFLLGPATYGPTGLYQYAVVSDPLKVTLFVLARNVTDFYARYDTEVTTWLSANGYNGLLNTPIKTTQLGCVPF